MRATTKQGVNFERRSGVNFGRRLTPLRPLRSRHGCPTADRLTQMAPGDTTVGSRPTSNGRRPARRSARARNPPTSSSTRRSPSALTTATRPKPGFSPARHPSSPPNRSTASPLPSSKCRNGHPADRAGRGFCRQDRCAYHPRRQPRLLPSLDRQHSASPARGLHRLTDEHSG